jgi:hypothetical protein
MLARARMYVWRPTKFNGEWIISYLPASFSSLLSWIPFEPLSPCLLSPFFLPHPSLFPAQYYVVYFFHPVHNSGLLNVFLVKHKQSRLPFEINHRRFRDHLSSHHQHWAGIYVRRSAHIATSEPWWLGQSWFWNVGDFQLLTRLIAREDFINVSRHKSFRS